MHANKCLFYIARQLDTVVLMSAVAVTNKFGQLHVTGVSLKCTVDASPLFTVEGVLVDTKVTA